MAINPLQLPGSFQSPSLDFSPLANLGKVYEQARTNALRNEALQGAQLDGSPQSLSALATKLLPYDQQGAMTLAQLANTASNRQQDVAWRQQESERAQRNADRSYGLQARSQGRLEAAAEESSPAGRARNAAAYGIESGTPEFKTYVLTGKLPDSVTNGGVPEVGLTPAYGTTADGKVGAIQFSKNGKAVQTQLPDGFSLQKEPIRIDSGTHITLIDPISRQTIGTVPKNLAAKEREEAIGAATGAAEVALPTTIANSEQILKTLDTVQNHPGKKYGLGPWSMAPTIPGSPQADFRAAADQLQGQTFLQAFQSLKGGGAITDIEGKKGENAIARLSQAQSQAAYDSAIDELRGIVKSSINRAKSKAKGPGAPAATSQSAPADPLGIR